MSTNGVAILETEVRELIRRRGVDPVRDKAASTGSSPTPWPTTTPAPHWASCPARRRSGAVRAVLDAVAGLGPLQKYLDDPDIEEIWINSPAQVFVARGGQAELTTTILSSAQVRDLVEQMLKSSGRRLDISSPFVDAALPGGERLHVVIPDVTREHLAVNIRKHVVRATHLDHLVRLGSLTPHAAAFLHASVEAGLNILVAGATQAGKTTMLNALAARSLPGPGHHVRGGLRAAVRGTGHRLDAVPTAQPRGYGEIPLRRLVKEALRMRPDRIVIGEVREAESFDLLIALNAGVPGMCTIHANSAREAISKMCTLPLLAGENVSDRFVVPTVAGAIDLVVHLGVTVDGRREVREIVGVPGGSSRGRRDCGPVPPGRRRLVRGDGFPPASDRFARAGSISRR
ncbi:ATPase, T2SS/T4P/T4SS family [Oerskovia sp. M15]